MILSKYLILIGRTFIATFFTVNFFNIIPLNLTNNAWLNQVSMLLVDTASLLLLGIVCMKLSSVYLINETNKLSSAITNQDNNLIIREKNNIDKINKFSRYLMLLFLILFFFQFYIFFKGMNQINNINVIQYSEIENKYNIQKNILEESNLSKSKDINDNLEIKLESLNLKKEDYLSELYSNISKARLLLIRGNIKVFIMSGIWAYGLYKLSLFGNNG